MSNHRTRILLVDDHPVVREGLRMFLATRSDFDVVGEAATPDEALALATAGGAPDASSDAFEARFFDLSVDMLCHLGFDGRFAHLNPAWERTLGFTRAELMSRPFIEFVHPDDRERTLKQNLEVRSGGRGDRPV